jgi:hypothetical protein
MSLVVYVKVSEGIVLAADSAATVAGEIIGPEGKKSEGVLKVFYNSKKLNQILGLPVGVLNWGLSHLEMRTISSLVEQCATEKIQKLEGVQNEDAPSYTVKQIADEIGEFIAPLYETATEKTPEKKRKPELGLIVAGYSSGEFFPEEWRQVFPIERGMVRLRPDLAPGRPSFGANWYGMTDTIVRMYLGYDKRLLNILSKEGWPEDKVKKFVRELEYQVVFPGMPLQDAIDFARFLVDTTAKMQRFAVGAERVGGPIQMASITHEKGFQAFSS